MLVFLLAALLCGAVVHGIGSALAAEPSPSASGPVTLHVGWTAEPDNLNPFIGWESSSLEIFHLNYDYLVGFRADDLQPVPALATSWEHSADGKVWTFKLREGVTWHDGEPFTADDVVFTFRYIMDNELGNYLSYTAFIDAVEAVDPYTVRFVCSRPKANMVGMPLFVVPEHIWSNVDPKAAGRSYPNKPPIVGTGPFQTVEWERGKYVRMVANKDYWAGAPQIDEIIFSLYQNADTMATDLRSGALQVAWDIPKAQFAPLDEADGITAINGAVNGFTHLGFNCYQDDASLGHPVLKDWRFRRALNWAIDKERVVDVAYTGHAMPATTLIRSGYYKPPLDYHWEPPADQLYTYDAAKAEAALDAAGYRDTDGDGLRDYEGEPIALRLYARSQSATDQMVGKLITGWLEKIGLQIDYQVIDEGALTDKIYNFDGDVYAPDYDLFLWYWYSDPDPNFLLSVLSEEQIMNWSDTSWSNSRYEELYREQQTTVDPARRVELVRQMQEIAYRESPYIPLTYIEWLEAYDDGDWTGWVRTPGGDGSVIYTQFNLDTYLQVHPVAASAGASSSSGSAALVTVIVVLAALAVAAGLLLARRRRGQKVEE